MHLLARYILHMLFLEPLRTAHSSTLVATCLATAHRTILDGLVYINFTVEFRSILWRAYSK